MIIEEQEYKRIKLNTIAKAKLGKKARKHLADVYGTKCFRGLIDKDGMVAMPLWQLMNIFGPICTNGSGEEIFRNLEILIKKEYLKD